MLALEHEIKELLITTLRLGDEGITPGSINANDAIFGDGLGLDSIDALEFGIAIQKRFGIKMSSDAEESRLAFSSIRVLAAFVASHSHQPHKI